MPIYKELVNPTQLRTNKIIDRAIIIDLSFYVIIACAGFFQMLNKTSKIILERDTGQDLGVDYPGTIAIICICGSLFVSFPCSYNPLRYQLVSIIYETEDFTQKQNFVMTLIFMISTCFISIVFPNIDKMISILGGLCAVTLDFTIPLYCFVKLSDYKWTHYSNFLRIIFFGILILTGYSSIGITIYLIITGKDCMGPRTQVG
jgi:amino acid permease